MSWWRRPACRLGLIIRTVWWFKRTDERIGEMVETARSADEYACPFNWWGADFKWNDLHRKQANRAITVLGLMERAGNVLSPALTRRLEAAAVNGHAGPRPSVVRRRMEERARAS